MRLFAEIDTLDDGDVVHLARTTDDVVFIIIGKRRAKVTGSDLIKALRHIGALDEDRIEDLQAVIDRAREREEEIRREEAHKVNAEQARAQFHAFMAQRGTDPTPEALERKARFEAVGPEGDVVQDGQPKRRISPRFSMSAKKAPAKPPADLTEAVQALPDFDTAGLLTGLPEASE